MVVKNKLYKRLKRPVTPQTMIGEKTKCDDAPSRNMNTKEREQGKLSTENSTMKE